MAASFLFYDLETSGVNPREARVMQFAAQRTDLDLRPIDEPHNYLIRLTPDVLPDPEAILVTGITPQQTIENGLTEAEFLKIFQASIATPGTVFTGFNSVRFDDELLRFLHYRNFYDPYEWSWKNDRSRWDMLDVARMTRALRPDGIEWPFASDGAATNRLELLAEVNQLAHEKAHDALSDVTATIALARLLKEKQPKLFSYLFDMRDKRAASRLVEAGEPFVYTSGRYDNGYQKTTVAVRLGELPDQPQAVFVYDLRHDPAEYLEKAEQELAETWQLRQAERPYAIPVKLLRYNRCPAIAPLGVLDNSSQKRLSLDPATIKKHFRKVNQHKEKLNALFQAAFVASRPDEQPPLFSAEDADVDARLYDGFVPDADKPIMREVKKAAPKRLNPANFTFKDERLNALLPLYKARNYPEALTSEEHADWEEFRHRRLVAGGENSRLQKFAKKLQVCAEQTANNSQKQFLLEELQLYAESIAPLESS